MRIFQLHVYSSLGGIENFTRDTFEELENRGHQNILLYGGARLTGLERAERAVTYWPQAVDFARDSLPLTTEALGIIEHQRPDVALIHTPVNRRLANAILDRLPTVYFAHNYGAFCPAGARLFQRGDTVCTLRGVPDARCLVNAYLKRCNTRRPTRLWELYRHSSRFGPCARRAEAVICDSRYVADVYAANGFRRERLHVLPSAVRIPPDPDPSSRPRGQHVVLFVGRLNAEKGLDYLIRALPRIPAPCRLVIAGAGPELANWTRLASHEGVSDRVQFLGAVDRQGLTALYAQAAVVAVPSVWPEPFGMVGPEAMSHRVPVVAFRVGGVPDWLLDGEVGFLVEPKDIDGLARRIGSILNDSTLGQRLGARGRQVVLSRFTLSRHVDGLLSIFEEAIRARRPIHARVAWTT